MFRHTYANVGCIVLEVNIDLAFTFHQYLPLTSTKLRASLGHVLTRSRRPAQEPGRTGPQGAPQARWLESVLQFPS